MTDPTPTLDSPSSPLARRIDEMVRQRPMLPYFAPFMSYLLVMALEQFVEKWTGGVQYKLPFQALRSIGSLLVALLFWRHYPPFGKLHLGKCIFFGVVVAFGWVMIHRLVAGQWLDGEWKRLPMDWYIQPLGADADPENYFDPGAVYGTVQYWLYLIVRIGGASTTVAIIEELFWRAFLLRALIDWHDFENVPLGKFTWQSFLICSVLSAAEHPQWEVGILCWMVYNGLFYWTRSILCLIVTHGITNFVLYLHIVINRDWVFW